MNERTGKALTESPGVKTRYQVNEAVKGLKLKIPRQLGLKLSESSRHRKSVELLLYLKYYCDEGRFKNTKENQMLYARRARISYNTYITRMVHLEQMELCYVKDGYLYIKDWESICAYFKLPARIRWYYVDAPAGKARLEDILEVCAMMEATEKFKQAFYYYLCKYPDIKENIKRVVGSTDRVAVHNSQLQAFLNWYRYVEDEDVYELNLFRADVNVSYRYWSDFFAYNSRGGLAYKKRKLRDLGLITYTRREYALQCHTTRNRRTWQFGSIHFDTRKKQPVLTLPDEITFHSLNTVKL